MLLARSKSAIKSSEAIESQGDSVSSEPDLSSDFLMTAGDDWPLWIVFNWWILFNDLIDPCAEMSRSVGVASEIVVIDL